MPNQQNEEKELVVRTPEEVAEFEDTALLNEYKYFKSKLESTKVPKAMINEFVSHHEAEIKKRGLQPTPEINLLEGDGC